MRRTFRQSIVVLVAALIMSLTGGSAAVAKVPPGMEGGGVPHKCWAHAANPEVDHKVMKDGRSYVVDTAGITCRDGQIRRVPTLADPYDKVEYIFGRSKLQIQTGAGWVTRDETIGDVHRSFGDHFRETSLKLDTLTPCATTLHGERYMWRTVTTWTYFVGRVRSPEQIEWTSDEVPLACA